MNWNYSIATLILSIAFMSCGGTKNIVKKQIDEGKVDFGIEYIDMPAEMASFASLLPTTSSMTFKDSLYRMDQAMPMGGKQITMKPKGAKTPIVLMDMMGRKLLVEQPPRDENAPQPTVELIDEEKTISGYVCKKAVIQMPNQDVPTTLWYCPQIKNWSSQFDVPGMPLQFDILQVGMKIRFTASLVALDAIDDMVFVVPEGYETVTEEELNKLIPGM